jgi:hypothetical protein
MYAAKFKMRTVAAIFKIGGEDLSKPIGARAKSVVGVDNIPNFSETEKALTGLLYTKYHKIPHSKGNKLKPD